MNRVSVAGGMGTVLALGLLSTQVARAQSAEILVRVERTPNVRTLTTSPNWVPITITVVDRATQAPPRSDYNVVAYATGTAGEQTDTFGCGQRSDNNPGIAKGIYDCMVIVDHGGSWTFHGAVNSVPTGKEPTVTLAQGSTDVDVKAGVLAGLAPKKNAIRARAREVVVLQLHSVSAGLWGLCVALLVAVALPVARRMLSTRALHRLEDHLGLLIRGALAATALVVGTGLYVLLHQTAYKTPWSVSAARGVFQLPYGKPYFLSMAVKLSAYAVMVLALLPLILEAQRRSHLASEAGNGATPSAALRRDPSPWAPSPRAPGTGPAAGIATLEAPAPERLVRATREPQSTAALARVGAAVIALGGATVLVCVTLLKYFHEFVEASRAVIR
jgi:hypothetical protein